MPVRCAKCGRDDLPDSSQFCYHCGFNVIPLSEISPEDAPWLDPVDSQDVTVEAVAISGLFPWLRDAMPQEDEAVSGAASTLKRDSAGEGRRDDDTQASLAIAGNAEQVNYVSAVDEDTQAGINLVRPAAKGVPVSNKDGVAEKHESGSRSNTPQSDNFSVEFELNIGQVLQQRYRLDELLGKGGYGAAYRAQDIRLKRVCVVKQLLNKKGATAAQLKEQRINFAKEAGLLVQLNHPGHPNIPEIYDYFYDDTGNYLVMKYIEGQNLKQVIEQNQGIIPWRDAVRYAIDVCGALDYMHTHSDEPIMHRDIKPANILLGDDSRIWLIDFGLAKENPLEKNNRRIDTRASGSVGYTPLEQWLGEAEPASDIYAIGATLHHMVTGLNPFRAFGGNFDVQRVQELHGNFVPIREVDQKLPRRLEGVIAKATKPEPASRPSARQLQQQLQVTLSGAQGAALYTFKNGRSAKSIEDLVDLCEKHRTEAQEYLYSGDFEQWFKLINRPKLANAAAQAVKQGKNERDGLEKFLKAILPNLLLRRLRRIGWQATRLAFLLFIILFMAALVIAFGVSYIIGQFAEQTLSEGIIWTFSVEDLGEEQIYTKLFLEEKFNQAVGAYFDDEIRVNITPPDKISISTVWNNIPVNVLFTVRLANNQPRVYILSLNSLPLYPITNNISRGINNGIETAFRRGPIDVSTLVFREDKIAFFVDEANTFGTAAPRPTLAFPSPTFTPLPPTPTPTVTPTPVKNTLVVIFNEAGEDVNIKIEGKTVSGEDWNTLLSVVTNQTEVIEPPAGTYTYTVTYKSDGAFASSGSERWVLKQAYRIRIVPDSESAADVTPEAASSTNE